MRWFARWRSRWRNRGGLHLPLSRQVDIVFGLSSVAGLVATLFLALKWDVTVVPLIYVCLLSVFLLIRMLRQERRARYSEVPEVLEGAYRSLHEAADASIFNENLDILFERLQQALAEFSAAFSLIVGARCRACLAELTVDETVRLRTTGERPVEDTFLVQVILRSEQVPGALPETPQPVNRNTDFLYVVRNGKPYLNNDLPGAYARRDYENSKWTQAMLDSGEFPYRSAMIWPIARTPTVIAGTDAPPLAFLCIDTKRSGAFTAGSDLALGSAFAHAIYPLVRTMLGSS